MNMVAVMLLISVVMIVAPVVWEAIYEQVFATAFSDTKWCKIAMFSFGVGLFMSVVESAFLFVVRL